jgi:Methylamine utilization protein MauJ/SEC-C motif
VAKIGRNEPCPCGSGKKYKHCCGSAAGVQSKEPGTAQPKGANFQPQMQVSPTGLPGQHQHLTTVFRFKPPTDPRNQIGPQGIPGDYKVTFVLQRPGYNLLPERQYSYARGLRGSSHLAITKPAFTPPTSPDAIQIRIYARTEDGNFTFTGFPDDAGFLGKVESEPFRAASFSDAEERAYRALVPSLSNWSVHLDIPLHIYQVDSTHVSSGNTRMSMCTPIWEVPFSVTPTAELQPEFRGYAGLYREALDSNSDVYAFLCLFKIIEGILSRRRRLAVEAKNVGGQFTRPQRRVPEKPEDRIPWLNAVFPVRQLWDPMALDSIFKPEVRGKKFGDVVDNILRPLRVDIAHALSLKSGELTLSVDELLHTQKVNNWLPLTKCIVRRMLKDEFPTEFLSYLKEDGTIVA